MTSGFAINVDLSLYFDDLRKCASVFVDLGKCKEVGDVEKHIKSVFKLEDNICLTNSNDFLIPRCEDIQILKFQQHETLKIQKCDFFDYQIHRYNKMNAACEQTALNLIHSERTIDLSCRPRQRFKISSRNQCINTNTHLLSIPFLESTRRSSEQSTPSTTREGISPIIFKDRQKSKKKKHHFLNDSGNLSDCNENGHDILDMSFKKPKSKNYENCFSVSETSEFGDKPSSNIYNEDMKCVAINEQSSSKEFQKKIKKRKSNSQNNDVDLASSHWANWSPETNSFSNSNTKGHKKYKSKKCRIWESEMVTDLSMDTSNFYGEEFESMHSSSNLEGDKSLRKKHKKYSEITKEVPEFFQNRGDSSSNNQSNQNHLHPLELYLNESDYSTKINHNGTCDVKKHKKKSKLRKNDIEDSYENLNDSINQFEEENQNYNHKAIRSSNTLEKTCTNENINGLDGSNREGLCNIQEQDVKSCTEFVETKVKRKRVRKHNKKKKRENSQYLSAVGPMLNMISTQVQIPVTPSEAAKHVFFNDDDFIDEMNIPPTPNRSYNKVQVEPETIDHSSQVTFMEIPQEHVLSVKGLPDSRENNLPENTKTPETPSTKPGTWQNELLKLATCTSKPVIFRRIAPISPVNQQPQASKELSPHELSSMVLSVENVTNDPVTNDNKEVRERIVQDHAKGAETSVNCNGEVNSGKEETSYNLKSSTNDKKKNIPDVTKPVEINTDKIILTNYPIIDKVVVGDLILFKVSRMDENNPVLSKTILGKVRGTAHFPEKISLQIIEGCEECTKAISERGEGITEGFMLDLRWVDILEPRLFYP